MKKNKDKKNKQVIIKLTARPQTPDEEQRFRVMLDSMINAIAKQQIRRDIRERSETSRPAMLCTGPVQHFTTEKE